MANNFEILRQIMINELHNPTFLAVSGLVKSAINSCFKEATINDRDIYNSLVETPNIELGQLSFPCFQLSKSLKNSPAIIAKTLAESFPKDQYIDKVEAAGPYLNFFLNFKTIGNLGVENILNQSFFNSKIFSNCPKSMIEYSQPNTHKVLHVGHMRNLCLGNSLVKIFKYCGFDVVGVTYPGDVGAHVAKCLWYLKHHYKGPIPQEDKGEWLGKIYTVATEKLDNELGTDLEPNNRAQLTEILKQIESKKGEYFELWKETRQWSIDLMETSYKWANVKFDRWFFESEVDSISLKLAKEYFEMGFLIESQGAIGMDLTKEKLGFCILIKSDGTGNYACKDVALAKKKFEEFKIEKSIYVVDERQSLHFKQVFKILENIGFKAAKDCFHLKYEMVELPDGAMSSRKGNIVPLMELVHQMEKTIKDQYLNKYLEDNSWEKSQVDKTATMIANGAIKYGMLRMDNQRKIVFDMKEWLRLDGETGPYLQYVSARIKSLCEKLNFDPNKEVNWELINTFTEKALINKLLLFNNVVEKSLTDYKPSLICSYLFDLGKLFNSFYAECPIGKAPSEDLKFTRLRLAHAVGMVMVNGLNLLGIPVPPRM
jgi:arginyl-tRNA synthetase